MKSNIYVLITNKIKSILTNRQVRKKEQYNRGVEVNKREMLDI